MESVKLTGLIGLLLLAQTPVFSQKKISVPFDVQLCDRNTVMIQWTRPGADSIDYTLEKSRDERTWERIADMNSQLPPYYDYIDLHRAGGFNYYRIVQRGQNEFVAVSDTKSIRVSSVDRLYLWPTPANDILHVRPTFVNGNIDIINSDGQLIRKIAVIDSITNVPLQALPGGIYFIRVTHGKDVLVEKFIKQEPL